jgi:hypothetical protein
MRLRKVISASAIIIFILAMSIRPACTCPKYFAAVTLLGVVAVVSGPALYRWLGVVAIIIGVIVTQAEWKADVKVRRVRAGRFDSGNS